MKLALLVAVLLLIAPAALASRVGPEPHRRAHVPLQWEQRRALTIALRRGQPIYCGGGRSNAVALTFDDGPGPYTETILRILRVHDAHATFFLVGNRIQYWPDAPRAEAAEGAVGNHTWSHPHLTDLPHWLAWLELARTQYEAQHRIGWKPKLFRPPYASHSRSIDATASKLGLVEVLWNVDARDDVRNAKVRDVVRNAVAGLRPGAIVLLHEIHPWTVRALPEILRAVRLRGLRAVSVPELLALDPPPPGRHCPLTGR
jgi:peptidoglycan/xylan/chitin deacetylase (PgdA/CDA1 family)